MLQVPHSKQSAFVSPRGLWPIAILLTEQSLNAVWEMHGAGTAAAAGCMHVLVCLHAFCRSLGSFIKLRAQVPLCC